MAFVPGWQPRTDGPCCSVGGPRDANGSAPNGAGFIMKTDADRLDEVMRRGRRIYRPAFTVYYMKQTPAPRPRIMAGQKVDKRAAARNKIRRRIRVILQKNLSANTGVIIIARKPILDLSFQQIKSELGSILNQIK